MKKRLFGPRMWVVLVLTGLVFGGLFFMQWFGRQKMNEFFDNMPPPDVSVSAAEAEVVSWVPTVEVAGNLVAVNGAQLTTEVAGIVQEIHHPNGAWVEEGEALVSLIAETDRAELNSLRATARLAEIELERARTLFQSKTISRSELDRRQSELDQAHANVAAQEARLEQKTLRAPFSGQLGIRRVNVGQYVAAGDPVIALQGLDPLYVNFTLPEQYSTIVTTGQPVQVTVASASNEVISGEITAIEPEVDAITRNFGIQATIRNPDGTLRPGMFARVVVPTGDAADLVAIPATAVAYRSYGAVVYVLKPEDRELYSVTQRFVTPGATLGDLLAVEGIEPGEMVATSGLLKLRPGGVTRVNNTVVPEAELNPTPPSG